MALLAVDSGIQWHHFRLGVKGGEINVLGRNAVVCIGADDG
jgi:hypothetical protein